MTFLFDFSILQNIQIMEGDSWLQPEMYFACRRYAIYANLYLQIIFVAWPFSKICHYIKFKRLLQVTFIWRSALTKHAWIITLLVYRRYSGKMHESTIISNWHSQFWAFGWLEKSKIVQIYGLKRSCRFGFHSSCILSYKSFPYLRLLYRRLKGKTKVYF